MITVRASLGGRTSRIRELTIAAAATHHGCCECSGTALTVLPRQAGLHFLHSNRLLLQLIETKHERKWVHCITCYTWHGRHSLRALENCF